jgi:hypothetical protein
MILYPWPLQGFETHALSDALEISMHYLEATGQASQYMEVQNRAADAILTGWRAGIRHKIGLANCGIVAIEKLNPMLICSPSIREFPEAPSLER